ncbi:glutathione S-transferase [Acinetobacter sp. ANC 4641]|uniref:glutathione S-transferase n=1 Tax=Acinetobacter sp. ANC 4641 TaxID=2529847 RepID=UPI00103E8DE4|nr:glutathione S-transferase [Acinetobacter sp. ANC 4641]TCB13680.1 glutathione S-transferase [Acinetobacter sp. ANC 4641]
MMILHYLQYSRAFRILWALEELQLTDYQIRFYKRQPNLAAPDELKFIHPLGKSPILQDGQHVFAESAVILEVLQQRYDTSYQFKPCPEDQEQAYQYLYWMHYAEGSLMPLLVFQLVMSNMPAHMPLLIRPIAKRVCNGVKTGFLQPRLQDHVAYIEAYLAEHDYFAGDFSFADIQMSFPLQAMSKRIPLDIPNIRAFLARIQQREAFQRAQEIDGHYQ